MSEMTTQEMVDLLSMCAEQAGNTKDRALYDAIAARLKALEGAVEEALGVLASGKGLPLGEDTGLNREKRAISILDAAREVEK